jgi:hypothetical protein
MPSGKTTHEAFAAASLSKPVSKFAIDRVCRFVLLLTGPGPACSGFYRLHAGASSRVWPMSHAFGARLSANAPIRCDPAVASACSIRGWGHKGSV